MEQNGIERLVQPGDTVILYRDPETEKEMEGYARVWEVLEKREDRYVLYVSFLSDPKERKLTRDYRRWEI